MHDTRFAHPCAMVAYLRSDPVLGGCYILQRLQHDSQTAGGSTSQPRASLLQNDLSGARVFPHRRARLHAAAGRPGVRPRAAVHALRGGDPPKRRPRGPRPAPPAVALVPGRRGTPTTPKTNPMRTPLLKTCLEQLTVRTQDSCVPTFPADTLKEASR